MKNYIAILMAIACAAALLLTGCGQNNDPQPDPQPSGLTGSVATDGSTSMQKVINTLGEAFMNENKGITFTYNPTGSGSGIKAVQEGRCDIGLSSRALKAEEKEAGLKETVLAYDGISIIVNPENPVSDLTLEQIAKLYEKERCLTTVIGDKLELTVEVMQQKGGSETTETYQMTLPHNIDGIIINLPAYMAGLPEEAYLEEFIPAPPTEEDDEEAPNTEDDMGLGDF